MEEYPLQVHRFPRAVQICMCANSIISRLVSSGRPRAFFEQMKGRGVRVIKPDDLRKEAMVCCMPYQNLGNRSGTSKPPQRRRSSVSTD